MINKHKEREPRKCPILKAGVIISTEEVQRKLMEPEKATKERKNINRKKGCQRASTDIDMTAKDIKDCADDEQMRDW